MKQPIYSLLVLSVLTTVRVSAQNIGIGTTHPQQKLHVAGGLRVDTLSDGKHSGLLQHTADGTVFSLRFSGDSTQVLRGDGTFGSPALAPLVEATGVSSAITPFASVTSPWILGGNAGVTPATNFLGTTDNADLRFRINNQWAGELDSTHQLTYYGYGAGKSSNGSAAGNTAIGYQALAANTSGGFNTAEGLRALAGNTTGVFNTANGFQSLAANTTGNQNTGLGVQALQSNTTGSNNVAVGLNSMILNTSGGENTAVGVQSLNANTIGNQNTSIGRSALFLNTTGNGNTAAGYDALQNNMTGDENVAIGLAALGSNTTGFFNVAMGFNALNQTIGGNNNVGLGPDALLNNISGSGNVAIGSNALSSATNSNNVTVIGFGADISMDGLSNATAIGNGATVTASNAIQLGNSSVTAINFFGTLHAVSDGRFKFNIKEDIKGLDFILKLRPVSYQLDTKKLDDFLHNGAVALGGGKYRRGNSFATQASYDEAMALRRTGFIAQEVEKAADESGYDFTGVIKPRDEKDHYSLSYQEFIMPMVKAMQEQQQQIEEQKQQVQTQQGQIEALKKMVAEQQKMIDELLKCK